MKINEYSNILNFSDFFFILLVTINHILGKSESKIQKSWFECFQAKAGHSKNHKNKIPFHLKKMKF